MWFQCFLTHCVDQEIVTHFYVFICLQLFSFGNLSIISFASKGLEIRQLSEDANQTGIFSVAGFMGEMWFIVLSHMFLIILSHFCVFIGSQERTVGSHFVPCKMMEIKQEFENGNQSENIAKWLVMCLWIHLALGLMHYPRSGSGKYLL